MRLAHISTTLKKKKKTQLPAALWRPSNEFSYRGHETSHRTQLISSFSYLKSNINALGREVRWQSTNNFNLVVFKVRSRAHNRPFSVPQQNRYIILTLIPLIWNKRTDSETILVLVYAKFD